MKRILITGGSGFIGTNLVQHWLTQGATVLNIDIQTPANPDHRPFWKKIDITQKEPLVQVVTDFHADCLFHLAARTDLGGAQVNDYTANTIGVENVIAAVKAGNIPRAILCSSQLVCTPGYQPLTDTDYCPPNAYGESKVLTEQIVRNLAGDDFTWVLLRPTSLWGPWFNQPYRSFFLTVKRGRYIQARGVQVYKSFGYVGNAVYQFQKLAECPSEQIHKKVFYFADYEPVLVSEWASLIQKTWQAPPIREVPLALMTLLAKIGDGLKALGWQSAPLTSYRLKNLLTNSPQNMEPLRALCGPLPFTLKEGTRLTVEWLREQEIFNGPR